MLRYIGIVSVGLMFMVSCAKNTTEPMKVFPPGCEDTVFFSTQIQPLFTTNCSTSGCHDQSTAQNGYVFETYDQIVNSAEDALQTIKHEPGVVAMPSGSPQLNDSLIQQLVCWIGQGKMNN
ncbi:hypothetical protein SAMN05216474_2315 [Lishizhenia tianjinensis]|uniref:Cytochrome c domain-containing protein n=1 Tax=Lishizhenia tianjinensis TaxID=477690 RepID=A0A1I7AQK0_9FLAO|nr:hypothetical protein [Lishizhenia tianjinensis]SFT77222.1 hypothetical protein SAMN05216474_2315 [Lishizhenia tianjinensis]